MVTIEDVNNYLICQQDTFKDFCLKLDPGAGFNRLQWDHALGPLSTEISHGTVFEKASWIYCDLMIDTPPELARQTGYAEPKMRCLVLEIAFYPYNPYVPKGYIELRAHHAGTVILAGGTDIFPYFQNREVENLFSSRIREICQNHGQDYDRLQRVRAEFFQSKFRKTKVGSHAGIYSFALPENAMDFIKALTDTFFTTYAKIVAQYNPISFSTEDKLLQEKLHGEWAEWILSEDEGTRFGLLQGIPPDALLGAILPPVARF